MIEHRPINIEAAAFTLEGCPPDRAANIGRLVFNCLERMLTSDPGMAVADRDVTHLVVPSLLVDWDTMDDVEIARQGATAIFRSLVSLG